jgi:hypothetical protein
MKTAMNYAIVTVISFSVGYYIFPIFNSTEQSSTQLIEIKNSAVHSLNNEKSTPRILPTPQPTKLVTAIQSVEQEIEVEEKHSNIQNIITTNKKNFELSDTNASAIKELNSWAISHKEMLGQTISENAPPFLADAMTGMISKNNDFLNNPKILQETQLDENWAYTMEQELRNLIDQNPASIDFS